MSKRKPSSEGSQKPEAASQKRVQPVATSCLRRVGVLAHHERQTVGEYTHPTKSRHLLFAVIGLICLAGCNHTDAPTASRSASNTPTSRPSQDPREASILVNPIQLTRNFDRAGEAYFSPDMKYIVFQ